MTSQLASDMELPNLTYIDLALLTELHLMAFQEGSIASLCGISSNIMPPVVRFPA